MSASPERVAGEGGGDLHDLLLVDHDPVRLGQDRLQEGMVVADLGLAVAALDHVVDHRHRTRPVERVEGGQVLEAVGLEALQDVAHAVRLELEQAAGAAGREHLVGLGIVRADEVDLQPLARLGRDHLHAVVDQGERAQAQEVHLQEADALDALHVVLRGDALRPALERSEGHEVGQGDGRDHDARGVGGGVARRALQPPRDVDQLLDLAGPSGRRPAAAATPPGPCPASSSGRTGSSSRSCRRRRSSCRARGPRRAPPPSPSWSRR